MEELNLWLTIIANLGVVGGLIFVGIQISQNTNITRASMSAEMTGHWITNCTAVATGTELPEVYSQAISGHDVSFQPEDWARWNLWLIAASKSGDFAYHQWQKGNLDTELWESSAAVTKATFNNPNHALLRSWSTIKTMFTPGYVGFVDSVIADAQMRASEQSVDT